MNTGLLDSLETFEYNPTYRFPLKVRSEASRSFWLNDWWKKCATKAMHWQWEGENMKLLQTIKSNYLSFFKASAENGKHIKIHFDFIFIIHFLLFIHWFSFSFSHRDRWNCIASSFCAIGIFFRCSSYFTIDGCPNFVLNQSFIRADWETK